MIQIGLLVIGCGIMWEGTKGFRPGGIRMGLLKSGGQPWTGAKGRVAGAGLIALGAGLVVFAAVGFPLLIGPIR